ncbi:PAS domain-containing protein [Roseomonas sp. JC162]|uniref:histidine kinase n=1 Tax=Neoroseomonas marina TaxID=1232220 RepID=A0A848E9F3_9PROT|nr:PAS domain-containing protein [Neoroseomonas marina]NMJ40103.1 PAS domain-containing protein [Neoroseomonas marina]
MQGSVRPGLAGRLRIVALAGLVPLLLGGALVGVFLRDWVEEEAALRLNAAARAAAGMADAEIQSRRFALQAFGSALDGERSLGALEATDAAARRVAAALDAPVGLLDRGLGMMVDTTQPFGTPLASTPAVAAGLWAIETGRARVSDVLAGPGNTAIPPMLLVPLLRDGRTEAVLSTPLDPDRLLPVSPGGLVALLDSRGRGIVERGGGPEDLPDWRIVSVMPQGEVRTSHTGRGAAVRVAVAYLSEAAEWRAVAWQPTTAAELPLRRLLPVVLGAVAVSLLMAAFAVLRTRRVMVDPIHELTRHAAAVAEMLRGDAAAPPPPAIAAPAELADLGAALAAAQQAAEQRERRLRALAEAGALVLWRADVAGGWTEAAGWAGLTGQKAPAFRGDGWIEMVHPDDRAPTLAEWGRALVARGAIGVEFRVRNASDDGDWRWVRATGVPISDEDGTLIEWAGAIHDVTESRGAAAAHRVNEAQVRQTVAELRAVYDTVPVGLALVDASLRFVNVNARFAAISGLPPETHVGRAPHEVMPEGLAGPLEAAQKDVLATGRPVLDVTCTGQAPGAVQNLRHWLASCHPVKDAQGAVTGVSAVLQDVTDRVRAERSRELLVTELNHRVKNTLATVQSIAAQSVRRGSSNSGAFGREFVGRLQALTRSHDLLAAHGWDRVDFARVVSAGLAPWTEAGRQIRVRGSGRIQVDPGQAQALILALHELATNAVKHGALSRPGGEVDVTWSRDENGVAHFEWHETGGPPVIPPSADRRGFGMRLLERGLMHDLGPGADVALTFPEDGLRVVMRFRTGLPALEKATPA